MAKAGIMRHRDIGRSGQHGLALNQVVANKICAAIEQSVVTQTVVIVSRHQARRRDRSVLRRKPASADVHSRYRQA